MLVAVACLLPGYPRRIIIAMFVLQAGDVPPFRVYYSVLSRFIVLTYVRAPPYKKGLRRPT